METQRLELLLDLMKTGSFSATAKKHYRTQPAISIAIKKIEEELGVRLIDRETRRVRLTPEGEHLKILIMEILRQVSDLKFQASRLGQHPKGRVKIATIHSIGLYELSDMIKWFIKKYQDIRLDLRYETSKKIYHLVEDGEVDFGIVAYPVETNLIQVLRMRQDEMVLISSKARKPQNRSVISLQQLDGMDFVTFSEDTPTRSAIEKFFRQAGIHVEIRFENENIETLKRLSRPVWVWRYFL
jgi:LysR family transcriptional regulator, transcriptional activator of the cysJI operon